MEPLASISGLHCQSKPLTPGRKSPAGRCKEQPKGMGAVNGSSGGGKGGGETWLAHSSLGEKGRAQHSRELLWTNFENRHWLE